MLEPYAMRLYKEAELRMIHFSSGHHHASFRLLVLDTMPARASAFSAFAGY